MREISKFELSEIFKKAEIVTYLPEIERRYKDRFGSWQRVELDILPLPASLGSSEDVINYTTWGCRVQLKIPPLNCELFFDRVIEILNYLSERHTPKTH